MKDIRKYFKVECTSYYWGIEDSQREAIKRECCGQIHAVEVKFNSMSPPITQISYFCDFHLHKHLSFYLSDSSEDVVEGVY